MGGQVFKDSLEWNSRLIWQIELLVSKINFPFFLAQHLHLMGCEEFFDVVILDGSQDNDSSIILNLAFNKCH